MSLKVETHHIPVESSTPRPILEYDARDDRDLKYQNSLRISNGGDQKETVSKDNCKRQTMIHKT